MKKVSIVFLVEVIILATAFYVGTTYHPVIRERVFSSFVEAETIKLKGYITNYYDGCLDDTDCMIEVNNQYWVTIVRGGLRPTFVDPQPAGDVTGIKIDQLDMCVNRKVEVYAQKRDESTLSIFGDEGYYVRVIDK